MVILQAPHELPVVSTVLPNPLFGDEESHNVELNVRRSMGGSLVTYVKNPGTQRFLLEFKLERLKLLEVQEFVSTYCAYNIRITDHRDRVWVAKIINDPLETTLTSRGERGIIRLEFEGELLDA